MPEQKRNRKRNNYTLSKEAQELIDKVPASGKSHTVSNAIVEYLAPLTHERK